MKADVESEEARRKELEREQLLQARPVLQPGNPSENPPVSDNSTEDTQSVNNPSKMDNSDQSESSERPENVV